MYIYRLKTAVAAIAHDQPSMKIVTLTMGTVVRTPKAGPELHGGLIDVIVDGRTLSMFVQDLRSRAELVEEVSGTVPP